MISNETTIVLQGGNSVRHTVTRRRMMVMTFLVIVGFATIGARLIYLGSQRQELLIEGRTISEIEASRPPILDRNGLPMAVDIRVPSLYAEPKRIIDVQEAVEAIRTVLPEIEPSWLTARLTGEQGFVWIKRELTPAIRDRIMRLGIPGIDFLTESRRFYPGGRDAAHILGAVNIDNQGIAGIERGIDDAGVAALQAFGLARNQELAPITMSIDLRVQHAMRTELVDAIERYKSIAGAGVMMDAATGEILALVSLPDFDPNAPASALEDGAFNRITAGNFELGSVVKTVSFAAALNSGEVTLEDSFDARFPLRFGGQSISDYRGQARVLTVPEIFRYSSNVGTIQIMQAMGKDAYRDFFARVGFDRSIVTELPERAAPNVSREFSEVVAATASFGHGFSVSPLHMTRALAAFVNGGDLLQPTFYLRTEEEARALSVSVISPGTSEKMRQLLRFNAVLGSGSRMNRLAEGYRAGGKTGTAEKVVNGRYGTGKNLNVFVTTFPMEAPRYVMLVLLDEAEPETPQSGNTAGWNAGEVSGRIVSRVAPMLGIPPAESTAFDEEIIAQLQ